MTLNHLNSAGGASYSETMTPTKLYFMILVITSAQKMSPHDETETVFFFIQCRDVILILKQTDLEPPRLSSSSNGLHFRKKYEQINLKSKSSPVVEVVLSTDGFSLPVFSETLLLLSR